jgi:23S rRNA pseudouridine1911/1915/1917 synthase
MTREVIVVAAEDNLKRLDVFISNELENFSRSRAKTAVDGGFVFINSKLASKAGEVVKCGDTVEVLVQEPQTLLTEPQNIPLEIIYEDSDLAVVNKPQGMVTHPATGSPSGTLVNALLFHIKDLSTINGVIRPGIVHRLDKDTSGLLAVAKNDVAHNSLAKQIAQKSAARIYTALVDGNIKEDSGKIEAPIDRSKTDRKKMAVAVGGRHALTFFKVLQRFGKFTLVQFQLHTGRTHQIRVHANYIKHPVVNDAVYGGSKLDGRWQMGDGRWEPWCSYLNCESNLMSFSNNILMSGMPYFTMAARSTPKPKAKPL